MLDQKFIESQRKALEKLKKRLEDQIKKSQKYPELGVSPEDNAQEVEAFESNIALEDRLVRELREVEKALVRIEKKEYGKCVKCGQEISRGRLEAYPAASLCVQCASKTSRR